ncbi:hypothetical protein K432DRAFT_57485 [Lepidopterella palustris CBS 459.81]|uniref:Uncharacterized protein n=1 Tax=Lepidopterella palustris CBS 459.81 TaxID=1314670 RepID=A0A8E2E9H7_9PEZI|nr:hypothetical protein K432DRAFT_57485 [Lepidopterella palustris CBS 459.81]
MMSWTDKRGSRAFNLLFEGIMPRVSNAVEDHLLIDTGSYATEVMICNQKVNRREGSAVWIHYTVNYPLGSVSISWMVVPLY